jgi:hypothetical protein
MEEVPDVAFVDEGRDPTLAAAVRKLPPQRRTAYTPYAELSSELRQEQSTSPTRIALPCASVLTLDGSRGYGLYSPTRSGNGTEERELGMSSKKARRVTSLPS